MSKAILTQKTDIFQLIKEIPIAEIARRYLPGELRRQGNRWAARCPLHEDNTPSFYVFPDGGWKCFGCGEYGDAVDLVAKVYNLRHIEAARIIARDFGLLGNRELSPKAKEHLRQIARARAAELLFKQELNKALGALQLLVRCTHRALSLGGWQAYMELSELVHRLPQWEHLIDCLMDNDIEVQAEALTHPEVQKWLTKA